MKSRESFKDLVPAHLLPGSPPLTAQAPLTTVLRLLTSWTGKYPLQLAPPLLPQLLCLNPGLLPRIGEKKLKIRGQAKTTTWPGGVAGQQVRLSHILLQPEG